MVSLLKMNNAMTEIGLTQMVVQTLVSSIMGSLVQVVPLFVVLIAETDCFMLLMNNVMTTIK